MRYLFCYLIYVFALFTSCQVSNNTANSTVQSNTIQQPISEVDSLDIPLPLQPSVRRDFDLIHTALELSLNWEKQTIKGQAQLHLKPYFYAQEYLLLDAKAMDIHTVNLVKGLENRSLNYIYDSLQLFIELDREYSRNESLVLEIAYTANPNRFESLAGDFYDGEKGAYFIDPLDADSLKPRQFWTHGETAYNSVWFPTIDQPNERTTQELFITVDSVFTTLSNGILKSSRLVANGKRIDHWVMDKPHAPYLFSLVVGEFAGYEESYGEIPLGYYVEPPFAEEAKYIFGNTPGMMALYEDLFGVAYPWSSYKQVSVRDFVAGAMENTTNSIFMEEVQEDRMALLDNDWDYIIAHELVHQWFGNLVTCEAWSQIVLNEGFANYGEYLWEEHDKGLEYADQWLLNEKETYLIAAEEAKNPLIRERYLNPDDLFDAHSYSKGGLVIHMLRSYVGDEAFFAGLKHYLTENAYTAVEVEDLRLAMEEVTGEDLNWFFDQWFYSPGHPILQVDHRYKDDTLYLAIQQIQDLSQAPVYKLPFYIDVYFDSGMERIPISMTNQQEEYAFVSKEAPRFLIVDGEHQLLAELYHQKSPQEYQYQYYWSGRYQARLEALDSLAAWEPDSISAQVFTEALGDSFYEIREIAIAYFMDNPSLATDGIYEKVYNLLQDSVPSVRGTAIQMLGMEKYEDYKNEVLSGLSDSAYSVIGSSLEVLYENDTNEFAKQYAKYTHINDLNVMAPIAAYLSDQASPQSLAWFINKSVRARTNELYFILQYFSSYLLRSDAPIQMDALPVFEKIARSHKNTMVRFAAIQGMLMMSENEGVWQKIEDIVENDRDKRLTDLLEGLMANY